jgi:hypothetical protein
VTVSVSARSPITAQGLLLKNARERMDVLAAYREVGSYRGAADICGTTHKTVRRIVQAHEAGGAARARKDRSHNYEDVRALVTDRVRASHGRISAKRLLPAARAAGYGGSARNFRRLVAEVKAAWRAGHHRGRRPAVWTPGDTLAIDWGSRGGLHVFCAVLAWSRVRFVRFAANERSETTLRMLAECFEVLGGVPNTVLASLVASVNSRGGLAVAQPGAPVAESRSAPASCTRAMRSVRNSGPGLPALDLARQQASAFCIIMRRGSRGCSPPTAAEAGF